jgi:hypothetical protein
VTGDGLVPDNSAREVSISGRLARPGYLSVMGGSYVKQCRMSVKYYEFPRTGSVRHELLQGTTVLLSHFDIPEKGSYWRNRECSDRHYIIVILVITFMQDIYNYVPKTNHVSRVNSVAAVLYWQSVLHVYYYYYYYYYYWGNQKSLLLWRLSSTAQSLFR